MEEKQIHAVIRGRVQGVFFRDNTRREAIRYGITGWVRNCTDGSVETVMSGTEKAIAHMELWLTHGEPPAQVSQTEIVEVVQVESFKDFSIRY